MTVTADEKAFEAAWESLSGGDYDEVKTAVERALGAYREALPKVHVVFDGFPGPDGPRFIEVETPDGHSIGIGEWIERPDGLTALVLPLCSPDLTPSSSPLPIRSEIDL